MTSFDELNIIQSKESGSETGIDPVSNIPIGANAPAGNVTVSPFAQNIIDTFRALLRNIVDEPFFAEWSDAFAH